MKGVNKKLEFKEGLSPVSKVYMQKKLAYINTNLLYTWLREHFTARKPQATVLVILDGLSSHSSTVDMLEAAPDNDVILLCLPSHTTSALQHLDRAVFGPCKLIANVWVRAATLANTLVVFEAAKFTPLDPNALPESEFAISDIAMDDRGQGVQRLASDERKQEPTSVERGQESALGEPEQRLGSDEHKQEPVLDGERPNEELALNELTPPRKSPSLSDISQSCLVELDADIEKHILDGTVPPLLLLMTSNETPQVNNSKTQNISILSKETPSKFLQQSSTIPKIPLTISKRAKQSAEILNS